jgi:hypothetical protein
VQASFLSAAVIASYFLCCLKLVSLQGETGSHQHWRAGCCGNGSFIVFIWYSCTRTISKLVHCHDGAAGFQIHKDGDIKRYGEVISTASSYFGGPGFKSWHGGQLSWLFFFCDFP